MGNLSGRYGYGWVVPDVPPWEQSPVPAVGDQPSADQTGAPVVAPDPATYDAAFAGPPSWDALPDGLPSDAPPGGGQWTGGSTYAPPPHETIDSPDAASTWNGPPPPDNATPATAPSFDPIGEYPEPRGTIEHPPWGGPPSGDMATSRAPAAWNGPPLPGGDAAPTAPPASETTTLAPPEEAKFEAWAKRNRITDVDNPDSFYDYRGFWKATGGKDHGPGSQLHFPDTFKQHGHPTFSVESQYAAPGDPAAGHWDGDTYYRPDGAVLDNDGNMIKPPPGATIQPGRVFAGPVGYGGPPSFAAKADRAPFDAPASDGVAPDERLTEGRIAETGPGTAAGFDAETDRLTNDPVALAEAQTSLNLRRESERNLAAAHAAEQQRQDIETIAANREKARAAAQADLDDIGQRAKSMSEAAPFQSWWQSQGPGQKMANIFSAVFGGLMMAKTGGRNSAIDAMMKVADEAADQQWKKLNARRDIAQGALNNADQDYKDRMALKLAAYNQVLQAIDAKAASFDPEGTAANAMAQAKQEVLGRIAAAQDATLKDRQKQMLDAYNADSQRMQAEAQVMNAQSLSAKRAGMGGVAAGGAGAGKIAVGVVPTGPGGTTTLHDYAKAEGFDLDAANIPPETQAAPYTAKQWDAFLKHQTEIGNAQAQSIHKDEVKQNKELALNKVKVWGPDLQDLKGPDGQPIVAPDEATATEARDKMYAAASLLAAIAEIKSIRAESSRYSRSDWVNSDAAQRLHALQAYVGPLAKAGTSGLSSENDMKLLFGSIGADNIQSFRDQSAKLDEGAKLILQGLNFFFNKKVRYGGRAFTERDFPNIYNTAPAKRDPDIDAVMKRDGGEGFGTRQIVPTSPANRPTGPLGSVKPAASMGPLGPTSAASDTAPHGVGIIGRGVLTTPTEQQAHLNHLEARAGAPGDAGVAAVRELHQAAVADNSDPVGRGMALRLLVKLAANGNEAAKAVLEGDSRDNGPDVVTYPDGTTSADTGPVSPLGAR